MAITRIWIEPGCIECRWCYELAPDVFAIGKDSSYVQGKVLIEPVTGLNEDRIALKNPLLGDMAEFIEFVAAGCPTSVIKLEIVEMAADVDA